MIYIPKENKNTVHLDQSIHNNEYFHHPKGKDTFDDELNVQWLFLALCPLSKPFEYHDHRMEREHRH